jgi:hypothetical protein
MALPGILSRLMASRRLELARRQMAGEDGKGPWQDKSRASFGHGLVGFLPLAMYGNAENGHTIPLDPREIAPKAYGAPVHAH